MCYNEGTTREKATRKFSEKGRKKNPSARRFPIPNPMTFWKSYDLWVGSSKRNRYETRKQRRRGKRKIQTENSSESLLKKTKPHSTHSQPFRVRKQSGKRTPKADSSRCVGFSSQTKKYPILTREHSNAWNSGDEERKERDLGNRNRKSPFHLEFWWW